VRGKEQTQHEERPPYSASFERYGPKSAEKYKGCQLVANFASALLPPAYLADVRRITARKWRPACTGWVGAGRLLFYGSGIYLRMSWHVKRNFSISGIGTFPPFKSPFCAVPLPVRRCAVLLGRCYITPEVKFPCHSSTKFLSL